MFYLTMILLLATTWESKQETFQTKEECYEIRGAMIVETLNSTDGTLLISSCEGVKDTVKFTIHFNDKKGKGKPNA